MSHAGMRMTRVRSRHVAKNRLSAQNTRKRKKLYIEILEMKVDLLESKVRGANHENRELAGLLRENGIEFDDSPIQPVPIPASKKSENQFGVFINSIADYKTEKDILKGFSDMKVV